MPTTPRARRTPAVRRLSALMIALLVACSSAVLFPAPAHAAAQGVGFGSWAPISPYGWHGSMLVAGVHTYCILPGAPAPTGESVDQGISTTATGLSPQQLTRINLLVTKYGQTGDPVQAAAVGWAVKALANWDDTLHHFGYPGDSLAGAIHWTFSALAPEHTSRVQELAVAYYEEAKGTAAGIAAASGALVFTTDEADPSRGSVRVDATTPSATGSLSLTYATFLSTGTSSISDAVPGVEYAIVVAPPEPGRPYSVSGSGRFTVTGPLAAVRHFTTAGGQDTAGPAGSLAFDVVGTDAAPRVPRFAPTITTRVATPYIDEGPFIDEVIFGGSIDHWPRGPEGDYLAVTAAAEVFRTDLPPGLNGEAPADATQVGSLGVTTEPGLGPTGPYRVASLWELSAPGFYTAVWTIRAQDQTAEVAPYLADGYTWTEAFGEPSQIAIVSDVSSLAQATAEVGAMVSDKIIVSGPIPVNGLTVTSSLYRAVDGVEPMDACTEDALVWTSTPHTILEAGEHVVTSPAVVDAGIYYWQERAVDAAGALVHVGTCGVAQETTRVEVAVESSPRLTLAATGASSSSLRTGVAVAIALLSTGTVLLALARRRRPASGARRFGACPGSG